MKSLSIISLLVIGLALAWAGFTPQVVNASPQLIGAGAHGECSACYGDQVYNCGSRGCCANANYSHCKGYSGAGTCYKDGNPCSGPSYCYSIISQHCW
jgi:hypothetical protein